MKLDFHGCLGVVFIEQKLYKGQFIFTMHTHNKICVLIHNIFIPVCKEIINLIYFQYTIFPKKVFLSET